MRNIVSLTHLFLLIISSPIVFIAWMLRLCGLKRIAYVILRLSGIIFCRILVHGYSAGVVISGQDKVQSLPKGQPYCYVGNHQSGLDIITILAHFPTMTGFLVKKELLYAPFLNIWMGALRCVYIDRSSPKKALKALRKGAKILKTGYPLVVFPEGTRSKSEQMGEFKRGAFKMIYDSQAVIIPFTLGNTAHIFEHSHFFHTKIYITFHDPVPTKGLTAEQKQKLPEQIKKTIASVL